MNLKEYKSYKKLALAIIDYINYYNTERPQLKLNEMTPFEYDTYLSNKYIRKLMLPTLYLPKVIYA